MIWKIKNPFFLLCSIVLIRYDNILWWKNGVDITKDVWTEHTLECLKQRLNRKKRNVWCKRVPKSVYLTFQFVAPLNSMANNIGGSTMHTWAGLRFTNSEGIQISGDMLRKGKDNVSKRQVKCAKLRFLFIDEADARWTVYCCTP